VILVATDVIKAVVGADIEGYLRNSAFPEPPLAIAAVASRCGARAEANFVKKG